jgi:hypothetical protein
MSHDDINNDGGSIFASNHTICGENLEARPRSGTAGSVDIVCYASPGRD